MSDPAGKLSPDKLSSAGPVNFTVEAAEAGQKLMNLLERRLSLPQPLLHRWIRTGQVRINGKRCQPFLRINEGDAVRLPPFAGTLSQQARQASKNSLERSRLQSHAPQGSSARPERHAAPRTPHAKAGRLDVVAEDDDYYAVFKPAGLPVHPGTGHTDAVTARLAAMDGTGSFAPTPVHRLDRDTTGILLVAKSYTALKLAHDAIRNRHSLHKEYLVWVHGIWHPKEPVELRHFLRKDAVKGRERMLAGTKPGQGQEAVLIARLVRHEGSSSLLQVRILTGRTHQIRAQLASVGHPVLGDGKYGQDQGREQTLYLHSARLILPDGRCYEALPRWSGRLAVSALPQPLPDHAPSLDHEHPAP